MSLSSRHRSATITPRILLLTSALGSGHVRAAQAIQAALSPSAPAATVQTLDWWSLMNPGAAEIVQKTYLQLVQEHAELYQQIYQLNQSAWRDSLLSTGTLPASLPAFFELLRTLHSNLQPNDVIGGRYLSDRMLIVLFAASINGRLPMAAGLYAKLALIKWGWARLAGRLRRHIAKFTPDIVVSTQTVPAALIASLKHTHGLTVPSIAVPTDFGVNSFWNQTGTDLYCLAHDENVELPIGFDNRRAIATGLPLMPGFTKPVDSATARRVLCLRPDIPVILILGGGLGLNVDVIAERLLHAHTPMQLVALKGRNVTVSAKLAALAAQFPARMKVFDWTERTDVFIRAADLVVGKPGGLTVAEVLACGRPLLMTQSLRGQEDYNVRFITKQQVGMLASNAELVDQVDRLLSQPASLAALKTQAWHVGRRNGAAHIAGQILVKAAARTEHGMKQAWQLDYERWNDSSVG